MQIFNEKYSSYVPRSDYLMTDSMVQVGNSFLRRSQKALPSNVDERHPLRFLQANARALASLVECVNMNWLAILVSREDRKNLVDDIHNLKASSYDIIA